MMTWNIHHGKRKDGVLDLASQVKFIVSHSPHVVVLQEVQTWDEHQPSKLKSLLEQQTGVNVVSAVGPRDGEQRDGRQRGPDPAAGHLVHLLPDARHR
jgi:endonuclease/exonuclease/phosphatase family metal-dependent hydrolase